MKKQLQNIKKEIEALSSLNPGPKVNKVFSNLVQLATSFKKKEVALKEYFQKVASDAEIEMEKHWAKKIINSSKPEKILKEFWYYKNYQDLTKLEFGSLALCQDHKKHSKVLFVGSGPLPLTGIFLARDYGCFVTFLDLNKDSLELSEKVCKKLNIKNIKFILADAFKFANYENYDAIFVAAMLTDKKLSKENFINILAKKVKKYTHILVRSVFHNRELLYKKFDVAQVRGLEPVLEVRPKNGIVNSFHVFEK